MLQPRKRFGLLAALPLRIFQMRRRITWLIPVLALLTLSGCIIFPHGHGDSIAVCWNSYANCRGNG
ncbi:hypothetical protein SAMN05216579_2649 [Pseudomonas granadensis]|nr:hypothetical protein SAMN05216579_2649 [Pseudomonas granadensis]